MAEPMAETRDIGMSRQDTNGRTHEPALRELTAELDGFKALMDERDRRYEERNAANKDAVTAALASAERASEKTELALKEYKTSANEWRDTVKDLVANMPTLRDVKAIEEKIAAVREIQASEAGKDKGVTASWGLVLGVASFLVMLIAIGTFVFVTLRQPVAPTAAPVYYAPMAPGTLAPVPSTPITPK